MQFPSFRFIVECVDTFAQRLVKHQEGEAVFAPQNLLFSVNAIIEVATASRTDRIRPRSVVVESPAQRAVAA
jgi:hypothetical protein